MTSLDEQIRSVVAKATKLSVTRAFAGKAPLFNSTQKKYTETLATLVSTTNVLISGVDSSAVTQRLAKTFEFGQAYGVDPHVVDIDWKTLATGGVKQEDEPDTKRPRTE